MPDMPTELKPISELLKDPSLTEIMVNGPDAIYVEREGRILLTDRRFADENQLLTAIDALVSAGAFLGVLASWRGLQLADPVAGLLITAMILYILAGTIRQLFYRMMDAVDPELLDEIEAHARAVPGVLGIHDVNARWVGRELAIVMHVDVDPKLSLKEAHALASKVEKEVGEAVPAGRLDVHMDPGTGRHQHGP